MGGLSPCLQPSPFLGFRVAPLSLLTGVGEVGDCGGRKAFSSLLLREVELEGVGTCAETLTASVSIKATVIIAARILNRDDRLNQAVTIIFFSKVG
jgi:hypothetical protein